VLELSFWDRSGLREKRRADIKDIAKETGSVQKRERRKMRGQRKGQTLENHASAEKVAKQRGRLITTTIIFSRK